MSVLASEPSRNSNDSDNAAVTPPHTLPLVLPNTAGLGLRRDLLPDMAQADLVAIDFLELAPENWIGMGGRFAAVLRSYTERFDCVAHGLSLSLGSVDALDWELLGNIKAFMQKHGIQRYTEHLSWCSFQGQLYDLLPIPNTEEAVHWVANRIRQVQDFLGMPIGVENASYYIQPQGAQMEEVDFINAVIDEADCLLHLDVNNIYVNSKNFGFDALDYLHRLPLDKVCYMHVAGHYVEPDGFIVDTHGADVIDPVWELLQHAYVGILQHQQNDGDAPQLPPTCLERDFNFPELSSLLDEVAQIKHCQTQALALASRAAETYAVESHTAGNIQQERSHAATVHA